ncbi:MAG: stalk domain-containing protein [Clostridia bacterium]|nr:stalk domain-containing protein [Clostridia bacterium]
MVKRLISALLALLMLSSMTFVISAEETKTYTKADITENVSVLKVDGDYFTLNTKMSYFGIKNVDLTGVKAIGLTGSCTINGGENAEIFRIKIDDPYGKARGFVVFNENSGSSDVTIYGNISEVTGVHTLYFATTTTKNTDNWKLKSISLSNTLLETEKAVPDSAIIDTFADTWVATDSYGRKVADFEEVGPVKEGTRKVLMFYHNWHTGTSSNYNQVVPDILKKAPEARYDFTHEAWGNHMSKYYWGEPVFGFYTSTDYWVYRKQAELFATAGVDALVLDYTNAGLCFVQPMKVMFDALADAKAEGVNVPKVTSYNGMAHTNENSYDEMMTLYYNIYMNEKYRDLWFHWEGKPFVAGYAPTKTKITTKDADIVETKNLIEELFTYRYHGARKESEGYLDDISWLDGYPQPLRGIERADGRVESVSVGVALNESTVDKGAKTGVFSDPYSQGRGFSKAFGEDYSADNGRKAYFFREQAALALSVDPAMVMIDGWNEWTTPKYSEYKGHKVAFVDLFDEENSRDFEPTRNYIKDDYYNLLCDFIRKYKGVRPAPVASAPVTIDIAGDASAWANVAPEYINYTGQYERDAYGFKDTATNQNIHYTTKVNNAVISSKVARDDNNFYFYAKTVKNIKTDNEGWMNLYINADRNYATGWEGYDYAVNKLGAGTVAKYENGAWSAVGNAEYKVSGNVLQMALPKALIGETGVVEFEFKWTDSVTSDDLLDFYSEGSVAPTGRFNYLYTEIEQTALTEAERKALSGTTIVKSGASKMIVSGGKMPVFEADTRVTAFESNGTLYVPFKTYEEILGYGLSKVEYDSEQNIVHLSRHDLSEDYKEITNKEWTYNVIGSLEARNNGRVKTLSAPVVVTENGIFVPVSYLSEVFGWNVSNLGNGLYAVSKNAIDASLAESVASHIQ